MPLKWPCFSAYILSAWIACVSAEESPVLRFEVEQPRAYGFYIGDKFSRSIELELKKPYELDEKSLPKAGRLIPWLALESPLISHQQTAQTNKYRISLTYQIVNIDRTLLNIGIPEHNISVTAGNDVLPLFIRPTRIQASMLTLADQVAMQANAAPIAVELDWAKWIWFGALTIASGLCGWILTFGLSFGKKALPFTSAYRKLASKNLTTWSDEQYAAHLRDTHDAFNKTAGKIIFNDGLTQFLAEHREFALAEEAIRTFYASSREYFFSRHHQGKERMAPKDVIALLKQCSAIERKVN